MNLPLIPFLTILPRHPHALKPKVRKPSLRRRRRHQPLKIRLQPLRIAKPLALLVRKLRKIPRHHIYLPLPDIPPVRHAFRPIPEKLQVRLRHRRSRRRIRHIILLLVRPLLRNQRRVRDPHNAPSLVPTLQRRLHKIRPRRLQRRRHIHPAVPMPRPRLQPQLPLRHFLPQILLQVLRRNPITNVPDVNPLPFHTLRIPLQPFLRLRQQFPELHPPRRHHRLAPVPEHISQLRPHSRHLHTRPVKPPPRLHNLIQLALPNLFQIISRFLP